LLAVEGLLESERLWSGWPLSVAVFGVSVLFVLEELESAVGFDLSVRLQSDSMAIKSATAKIEFISLALFLVRVQ
jgi:hypothetical protein